MLGNNVDNSWLLESWHTQANSVRGFCVHRVAINLSCFDMQLEINNKYNNSFHYQFRLHIIVAQINNGTKFENQSKCEKCIQVPNYQNI